MSSEPPSPVPPDNSLSAEDDCETPFAGEATTVPKSFLDRLCRELLEQFSQYEAVADAVTEPRENNEDNPGGGNDYDSNPSEFARSQYVTKGTSHCGDAAIYSGDVPEPLFVPEGRMDQHSNGTNDTLVENEGDVNLPASCGTDSWHNASYSGDSTLNDENDSHPSLMTLPQVSAERNSSDSETHADDSTSSQDGTSPSSIDDRALTTKKEEFRVRTSWKRWFLYPTTSDSRPSNEPDGIDRAVRRLKCHVAAYVEDHMDEYVRWIRDVRDTGHIYGGFRYLKDQEQPVLSTYNPTVLEFLKDTSWIGDLRSLMHVLEDPSHDSKNYVMLANHSFILSHIRPIYNESASEPPDLPPYKILTRFGSEDACFAIGEVTHFYGSTTSNFDKLARAWSYYKYGIIWLQRYRISAEYTIELVLAARTLLEANRKRLLKIDESWEPEMAGRSGFKKLLPVYNAETTLHEMPKNVGRKQEKRKQEKTLAKMVKAVEEENKQQLSRPGS